MSSHDGQHCGSRGSHSGSVSAVVPKIGTFRGESAFSTWLHRMAVNVVLMQLRKKSLPVVPIDETLETEEDTPKKELGAQDLKLAGSIDRLQLQRGNRSSAAGV